MRFDMICEANEIEHRLTKPPLDQRPPSRQLQAATGRADELHDQAGNGQTRPLRKPKPVAYPSHRRLGGPQRRPKTLNGLSPYGYICKIRTSEPERFILNPIHYMLRLSS